jgi:5-methylcytosine-specific restriction endonuclease McrBC regulatory subunit McrC
LLVVLAVAQAVTTLLGLVQVVLVPLVKVLLEVLLVHEQVKQTHLEQVVEALVQLEQVEQTHMIPQDVMVV